MKKLILVDQTHLVLASGKLVLQKNLMTSKILMQFRVGNMRQSQLVESHVRAILVSKKVTDEGEIIPYHPTELKVGVDIEGEVDNILFLWPATVIHKIDEESPLYRLNAQVRL